MSASPKGIEKMGLFEIFVIFVLSWWLSLFVTLPIGVRSQIESGKVIDGTDGGAPSHSNLFKKIKWATYAAISLTLFIVIVYYLTISLV